MNDAAIYFALIAVAVLGWSYAFALAMELGKTRKIAEGRKAVIEELQSEVLTLRIALTRASKNDHRDNKGRFAKAG
jgi:hypothetical protein